MGTRIPSVAKVHWTVMSLLIARDITVTPGGLLKIPSAIVNINGRSQIKLACTFPTVVIYLFFGSKFVFKLNAIRTPTTGAPRLDESPSLEASERH